MPDEQPEEPGPSNLPRYPGTPAPSSSPGVPGAPERPPDEWYTPPATPGGYYPPGSTPPPRSGWGQSFPGGPPAAAAPYAGYWTRAAGAVIDGVIIALVSLIYLVPAHAFTLHRTAAGRTHPLVISNGGALLLLALGALYAAFFIGLKGQTPGMMAMRIKAVDRTTGELIGFPRALGRDLLERLFGLLFFIPLVVDLLFPAWDPQHQTLHDKAVNSIVIRA
jgi:uncharacterized RDD family membrane protein YckC